MSPKSPKSPKKTPSLISLIVVEATPLACQLLSDELVRVGNHFDLVASADTFQSALKQIADNKPEVAVVSSNLEGDPHAGFKIVRELHVRGLFTKPVMLLDCSAPDQVIKAFSAGAKGIVCRSESVEALCRCIDSVYAGQIWANSNQLQWLVNALADKEPLRLFNAKGTPLLTKRGEQIVQMVADGMPNKEIASHLGVSAHTVKNHLFRIYEQLGISTRVELLLYAISNHNNQNHQ